MSRKGCNWLICGGLSAVAVLLAGSASASFISYRFDGDYAGVTSVAQDISNETCSALPLQQLSIKNGILRSFDAAGYQTVKGFITGDGFFSSDYIRRDGRVTLFEGFVDANGRLTGGIFDNGCAWLVEMVED